MPHEVQPADNSESGLDRQLAQALAALRARTPARLLVGRAGPAYRTHTQLDLREDHAVAVDAVLTEMDLACDFGAGFVAERGLFEVATQARDKAEFLKQPGLGRKFSVAAAEMLIARCRTEVDVQIAIGDGLSAAAVAAQVPGLLPLLERGAATRGWTLGQTFAVRHCRVGILNEIGAVVRPKVAILLIGERPGLATADSLSAYMAFRPQAGHTDAERNLISNIHARGVLPEQAVERILALAAQMMTAETSGVAIKEQLGATNGIDESRRLA
jgi:ethanolamine ammonia-lyase small subunit